MKRPTNFKDLYKHQNGIIYTDINKNTIHIKKEEFEKFIKEIYNNKINISDIKVYFNNYVNRMSLNKCKCCENVNFYNNYECECKKNLLDFLFYSLFHLKTNKIYLRNCV